MPQSHSSGITEQNVLEPIKCQKNQTSYLYCIDGEIITMFFFSHMVCLFFVDFWFFFGRFFFLDFYRSQRNPFTFHTPSQPHLSTFSSPKAQVSLLPQYSADGIKRTQVPRRLKKPPRPPESPLCYSSPPRCRGMENASDRLRQGAHPFPTSRVLRSVSARPKIFFETHKTCPIGFDQHVRFASSSRASPHFVLPCPAVPGLVAEASGSRCALEWFAQ